MISKNNLKYIKSLQLKKFRKEENKFLVEGAKSVLELLNSNFNIHQLLVSETYYHNNEKIIHSKCKEFSICTESEIEYAGSYSSNQSALAVVDMPQPSILLPNQGVSEYILMLDNISDPGNLGTIIRIADWYGISKIIASENTAELYNPKVIAASMGSFIRVNLFYTSLEEYLKNYKTFVYGASLDGKNIYDTKFNPSSGMLLLGSEAHGINNSLYPFIDELVFIPRFGGAESLNVSVATGIFCDHIKRQCL
ncbi:MAG: RNA methyltransferase [Cytophagales bacterium]|nr:MAG: RNA methyltransferase [Cytophagales bacterium]